MKHLIHLSKQEVIKLLKDTVELVQTSKEARETYDGICAIWFCEYGVDPFNYFRDYFSVNTPFGDGYMFPRKDWNNRVIWMEGTIKKLEQEIEAETE